MSPFGFLFCFLRRCWANLSCALDPGCCTAGGGLGWARQWRSSISSHLLRRREVECVLNCTGNKLQSINRNIGVYQHLRPLSRRNAVIIHRICIGHIRLTHSCLLSGTVRNVRLVIAHKQSSTFWLNVLHWLALVTIILLQQHLSSFVYRSYPQHAPDHLQKHVVVVKSSVDFSYIEVMHNTLPPNASDFNTSDFSSRAGLFMLGYDNKWTHGQRAERPHPPFDTAKFIIYSFVSCFGGACAPKNRLRTSLLFRLSWIRYALINLLSSAHASCETIERVLWAILMLIGS